MRRSNNVVPSRSITHGRRSGSAAVELAVVLPILVTLLLGVWEVGRMIQVKQILLNAAREGARHASTGAKSPAQVDAVVKNYLTAAGISTTGYTVKIVNLTTNPVPDPTAPNDDPLSAQQLHHLRVTVELPFNNVKWVIANQLVSNVATLSASADWYSMKDQPIVIDTSMPSN